MKKLLMLLCFAVPLLNSCVPLAVLAGATTVGVIVYDSRSFSTQTRDSDITLTAQSRIDDSVALQGRSHISIATFNGVVLMVGQAQTARLKALAYRLVKSVPHIKLIYNEVNIAGSTSDISRSNDAWITTKVKAKLLAAKGLGSTQIKVVTESGIVYLMGITSRKQANQAATITRQVAGVKRVVKAFEYRKST